MVSGKALIVDQTDNGDYTTISAAIKAAEPEDRILVRPGLYREGLVIDKPLEIFGDGEPGQVVVEATGRNVILFKTTTGRVSNLTLRQASGGKWFGVDIVQGRLELEGCDITSQSLACVAIHDWADPYLRRNRIHDGRESGVFIFKEGQGTLEDNDIFGHTRYGVVIKTGSNPTLRSNRIHDNQGHGVQLLARGGGTLEENHIFGNAQAGISISADSNPTLRDNHIYDNEQASEDWVVS